MNCMKREMDEWQRRNEWRARRFIGGCAAALVGAALCAQGMADWGMGSLAIAAGMIWSAR